MERGQWKTTLIILTLILVGVSTKTVSPLVSAEEEERLCAADQFQCLNLNLNQILSINDWNRRPKECIPQSSRCDGSHDCQDGSDEVECFMQLPRPQTFRCFVGVGDTLVVDDCLARDRARPVLDPKEASKSVSEMKEWACSKVDLPDGQVVRDCHRVYTGGDAFRACFTSTSTGSTCLCSRELCNSGKSLWISVRMLLLLSIPALFRLHN